MGLHVAKKHLTMHKCNCCIHVGMFSTYTVMVQEIMKKLVQWTSCS